MFTTIQIVYSNFKFLSINFKIQHKQSKMTPKRCLLCRPNGNAEEGEYLYGYFKEKFEVDGKRHLIMCHLNFFDFLQSEFAASFVANETNDENFHNGCLLIETCHGVTGTNYDKEMIHTFLKNFN